MTLDEVLWRCGIMRSGRNIGGSPNIFKGSSLPPIHIPESDEEMIKRTYKIFFDLEFMRSLDDYNKRRTLITKV